MIALCREHADKADHGAYTTEQLRDLKRAFDPAKRLDVRGRFDWMRRDLLAVVGGNFYYRCPVILKIGDRACIWFNRDEEGYLLLNFLMPTVTGEPRATIQGNYWTVTTRADEILCPPSGRLLQVSYPNGDLFKAEFFTAHTPTELTTRFPPRLVAASSMDLSICCKPATAAR